MNLLGDKISKTSKLPVNQFYTLENQNEKGNYPKSKKSLNVLLSELQFG